MPDSGPNWGILSRGYVKLEVMRLLAAGELSQTQIAEKYGVSPAAMTQFKQRNAEGIEEIRVAMVRGVGDELAGLWIAKKANRISEYQNQIDRIAEKAEAADWKISSEWIKTAQTAIRSVAEELGDLAKSQVTVNGTVHYTVEGVDPEALK